MARPRAPNSTKSFRSGKWKNARIASITSVHQLVHASAQPPSQLWSCKPDSISGDDWQLTVLFTVTLRDIRDFEAYPCRFFTTRHSYCSKCPFSDFCAGCKNLSWLRKATGRRAISGSEFSDSAAAETGQPVHRGATCRGRARRPPVPPSTREPCPRRRIARARAHRSTPPRHCLP